MKDDDKAKDKLIEELQARVGELEASQDKLVLEHRLQDEVMSNMAEGVVLIRADDGIILYCNQKFEQMFAYDAGELIGRNISVVNAPTDKTPEEVANEIIESLNNKNSWHGEVHNIKKTGEHFWCSATVSTFEDTHHGTVWISIHTDITRTKEAQEELNRFFNLSISMLCTADINGYFRMLSPSFEKTLGYTAEELRSKPYLEFVHPDDIESTLDAIKQLSEGNQVMRFENRYLCKDGSYKRLMWMSNPVPEEGITYCSVYDVTEQRAMQEQLKQELALQSSIAKVTEALLNPAFNKYDISKVVHGESLILTESEHGYVSLIDENEDNVAINLTEMMANNCTVVQERRTARFPKGPDGYNALWGHSLNTGESFFTNTPKGHQSYKNCTPPGHVDIRNFLSVAVKSGNKIVGQIALANSTRDYTDRDVYVIERLAAIYAVAIERKELEDKLRESEQRFRIIFEKAPIGAAITEADSGNFVQVNEEYCDIIGYTCEELTCRTHQEVTHPDDIQRQLEGLERLYRGDISVFSMEKRYIHKSNRITWVTITSIPLEMRSNQPKLNLAIVEDITEKKEMEAALKEKELDVIEAQAKAHFGTFIYDPVSQQSKWSLELYNIWGVDPKQGPLLYPDLKNYIHPDDWQRFDDVVGEAVQLRKPYELDIRICRPDKSEIIANIIGEPLLDADGNVVKLRGSTQDITERKKAEEELREYKNQLERMVVKRTEELTEAEERFRTAFEFSTVGAAITSPEKGWIEVNDKVTKMFGYSKDELRGMTWAEITHPDDIEPDVTQFNRVLAGEINGYNLEKRFIHKDGAIIHTMLFVNCKRRADGSVDYCIAMIEDITENKRMEEELRAERDKLKSIMDTMEDGVYITTKEHEIYFINRALMRDFGEVKGRKCHEYFHDKSEPCAWCKNEEVFSGKSVTWQWHSLKNNRTYSLFDTPLRNSDGTIYKFEIFHDITDIKNAQAMIQRELDFQTAVAEVSAALLSPDKTIYDIAAIVHQKSMRLTESLHGYVSEVDPITEEDVGHIFSDMANQEICRVDTKRTRLAFPKGKNGYNAMWGHSLNTKEGFYTNNPQTHLSYKGVIPQGHVPIKRFLSVPAVIGNTLIGQIALANAERDYNDDDLNVIKRLASIYALAVERKRMEEDLKQSYDYNKRLLDALDNVGTCVFIKDMDLRYVYANRLALEVTNSTMEELLGCTDSKFFTAEAAEELSRNDRRVIENNEIVEIEEYLILKNSGEKTIYLAIKRPLYDAEGKIYGLCGVSTDITERKIMEERLKRLNDHLMELVAEETQKRQQQEQMLIQQSKMAAMGEMIGLIAHQWRQPLNAIGMVVQDIKEAYNYGELNEKYIQETVDTTMNQVYFMSKTIEDFKDFFKPSKKKVRFDIKTTIQELLSMFEQMFKKSDVDISMITSQDTILVTEGYPNEFKQVILNIINNAKDAITSKRDAGDTIQGRIDINIINNTEGNKIIISIKDNGGGIPEHIMDKIFDPYYTTKGEKGTGIGLYMSKTIIETNMGGSLEVSNVDGGAEFVIELGT
ncbi:PAS domain S-box protein [Candidatus Magnetominusculus dajiuhuensis]|uniref:PAS domain S-box protein n=1 Tax=Candidatus Magnetominusculus dajiuhuensis TaxID=3137712 RepID=UPI003B4285E9